MFQVHSYTGVPQIGDLDSSICMILLSFQFVISAYNLAPHLILKHFGMAFWNDSKGDWKDGSSNFC